MWDALRPELLRWVGAIGRAFPRNHLPAQGQLRRLPTLFLVDERRHSGLGAVKVVLGFLLLLARPTESARTVSTSSLEPAITSATSASPI
jgi:hypothetical protein